MLPEFSQNTRGTSILEAIRRTPTGARVCLKERFVAGAVTRARKSMEIGLDGSVRPTGGAMGLDELRTFLEGKPPRMDETGRIRVTKETFPLDRQKLLPSTREATRETELGRGISPPSEAPSPSGFPPGVSMGYSWNFLEGPLGQELLEGLERTPWSPKHGRPGEWSKHICPFQGLTIRQEYISCEACGSGYGLQFIVKDDLWTKYGNGDGRMCLLCFEGRMGRELRLEDLMAGPGMNLLAFRIAGKELSGDPMFERVNRFRFRQLGIR